MSKMSLLRVCVPVAGVMAMSASMSGCADRSSHVYGYAETEGALEEQTRRDTAPSAAPIAPPPDEVGRRQIPPNSTRSPGVVHLTPAIETADLDAGPYFQTQVRNRMNLLLGEMLCVESDANLKDAPGRAAIAQSLRDFIMAQDRVHEGLLTMQLARSAEIASDQRHSINEGLIEAERAILDAQLALAKVPPQH